MGEWLGLMIGNSRLHWAYCQTNASGTLIQHAWDNPHLSAEDVKIDPESRQVQMPNPFIALKHSLPSELGSLLSSPQKMPLRMASVVPTQTKYWQPYPQAKVIMLDDIPLSNLYSTLGIDRALAVLGAWKEHQIAALVMDGGTALTLTGVDRDGKFIGGAILPGLGLQLRSLHQQTAALPKINLEERPTIARWQTNTPDSIRSGVWYSLLAGVESFVCDWIQHHPESVVVFTGGDGKRLWGAMQGAIASRWPQTNVVYDPQIIFKGMGAL